METIIPTFSGPQPTFFYQLENGNLDTNNTIQFEGIHDERDRGGGPLVACNGNTDPSVATANLIILLTYLQP